MATQANLDLTQQLYVAYYGRPAEKDGLQYWADRIEDEGLDNVIDAFGNSQEFQSEFGTLSNAQLVNNLYEQLFGRDAEPDGLAYWTNVLNDGEKSLAEIAVTIKNAATGADQQTFNARVEAADAYTEEFGSDDFYDAVAAKAVVENAEPGLYAPSLNEAITQLQAANQAESDYLQNTVAANEQVKADLQTTATDATKPTDAEIETSLGNVVSTATDNVADYDGDSTAEIDGFATASPAVRKVLISEEEARLDQEVTTAQAEVAKVDGLQAAISSMLTNKARYESALEVEASAEKALKGELGSVNGLNDDFGNGISGDLSLDSDITTGAVVTGSDGSTGTINVIEVGANGQLKAADNLDTSSIEGFDALLADAQAAYNAATNADKQETALSNSVDKVLAAEGDTTTQASTVIGAPANGADGEVTVALDFSSAAAPKTEALVNAEAAVEDFDEAVAEYQAIASLEDKVESLQANVEVAEKAFTELDVTLNDALTPGATADDPSTAAATDATDLFVYNQADGDVSISDFGASGDDQLYIGNAFSKVDLSLEGTDTLDSTAQGSANTLEAFFQDDGTDTTISLESEKFQGSATTGDFEGTQITLTGVTADQLSYENGFISIA